MIKRIWRLLPGPLSARIIQAVVLAGVFLVALHFFYDWVGTWMLDQGGTVG